MASDNNAPLINGLKVYEIKVDGHLIKYVLLSEFDLSDVPFFGTRMVNGARMLRDVEQRHLTLASKMATQAIVATHTNVTVVGIWKNPTSVDQDCDTWWFVDKWGKKKFHLYADHWLPGVQVVAVVSQEPLP